MVVDTMVFAYALLGVRERREAAAAVLEKADPIVVPDSCFAELANVAWQWVRTKGVPGDTAHEILIDAEALVTRSYPSNRLLPQALTLAIAMDHPAYDTLFIAAAQREGTQVVTFDERLRDTFPDWTLPPEGAKTW